MEDPTVPKILDLWPSLADFARDVLIGYEAAKQMRRRGSIPVKYWPAMIAAADRRGKKLTEKALVEAHCAQPAADQPQSDTKEVA